jgi:hypothetical protein
MLHGTQLFTREVVACVFVSVAAAAATFYTSLFIYHVLETKRLKYF